MKTLSSPLLRSLCLAALLVAAPAAGAFAQEAAAPEATTTTAETAPDTVVATVSGEPITEADLSFAAEDLAQDLAQMPAEERRAFLLRVLIDMKVMAGAAREAGMDQTELFAQRRNYLEERALRRAYFADEIAAQVTEEAVRAEYDAFAGQFQPTEEIRASHILVETKEEADAIEAELTAGGDFAAIAGEKSIDPGSGANGGDLGFFGQGMMVPEFETAAFALANPGDVSEPVQSQFGWHIIKLEEKRMSQPPAFEQVAPQVQQQVLMRAFNDRVEELMSNVTIEVEDPDLKATLDAQDAAQAAAREAAESGAAQQ
ncbi:peptidyl-prolyl cis-trans isomerase C [Devosia crocina]|uniref:Parvulin-like PPIase n=1 Tax=Devosia crocina TaxID=429728 RepID=A0A1I7NQN9_9HYPH|nr:peptidylprolyl isomerase [Devosia crocina]SFV37004.1 peptidyl-prolyl cis-trans isomerase C [Devosia crocina]